MYAPAGARFIHPVEHASHAAGTAPSLLRAAQAGLPSQ